MFFILLFYLLSAIFASIIFKIILSRLALLVRVVFAIPAASSKSERVFSVAGRVVTPDRNRLAPEMVEDLVMLKCNLRLLRNMSTVWKTYLLCLVWLRSDIQYICTYLGKPVLIWENNIWTSGFWFWFSDVFWILFIVFWSLCLCLSVFLSFRLFVLVNIYEFILVHN